MAGVVTQHLGRDRHGRSRMRGGTRVCDDDALQGRRELRADLVLLVRRVDVDDAVDGLRGVLRVQGREDQVTGLGGGQRDRDGLQVAHLADQDDVGVLPQHVLERRREAVRVVADLALVHQRALVGVHVLDRVLDGHDVVVRACGSPGR